MLQSNVLNKYGCEGPLFVVKRWDGMKKMGPASHMPNYSIFPNAVGDERWVVGYLETQKGTKAWESLDPSIDVLAGDLNIEVIRGLFGFNFGFLPSKETHNQYPPFGCLGFCACTIFDHLYFWLVSLYGRVGWCRLSLPANHLWSFGLITFVGMTQTTLNFCLTNWTFREVPEILIATQPSSAPLYLLVPCRAS